MKYTYEDIDVVRKDNGKKVYCTKCSCPASDPEKNVVIVHGLTSSQHVFDMNYKDYSMTKFYASNGYNVWRIDYGGYGRSDKYENGFDVDTVNASKDIVATLEKICEIQGVKNADIIGWSWGSMTSAQAAIDHPDLVRRMVWMGPCFGGTMPATPVPDPFTTLDYAYCVRVFQKIDNNPIEVDYDTVERSIVGIWCDGLFKYDLDHQRPNGGNRDIMEGGDKWLIDVDKVPAPVGFIYGTNDPYPSPERAAIALEKLPKGSESKVLRGAGHAAWAEIDYYKKVREFGLAFLEKEI